MKKSISIKNFTIMIPVSILLLLSVLNMYGASFTTKLYSKALARELLWIVVGFIAMFLTYQANTKFLKRHARLFYWLGNCLLLLVLFFGRNVNGATSWFKIGPISFQPSELVKPLFALYLATVLGHKSKNHFQLFLKACFITFIPSILIFLEPDTGVVLMYMLLALGMVLTSSIPKRYTFFILSLGITFLALFFSLYFLNGELFTELFGVSFFYRMDRLLSFKNSSSYQLEQALIGIGSSGLFGFGLTSKKIYIPEATTDFVFALSICNFGYLVGILIVTLYIWVLYKLYKIASSTKDSTDKCLVMGILFMMSFQVFEHILMNLGLTPITGITLPFLSYGGSSLLSYFILFGLALKTTTNSSSCN